MRHDERDSGTSTDTPVRPWPDIPKQSDVDTPSEQSRSGTPWQRLASRRALPYLLAGIAFVLYEVLSVVRHLTGRTTGYDLGIFEQVVRNYAHFDTPVSALKGPGVNILGDHFSPILAALGPVYLLFPSPVTLLTVQAAAFALSVVPITRLAIRASGVGLGGILGAAYALSWGIQSAVVFDFHEACLAVVFVAFCVERLCRQEWRAAVVYALPLLLVKEDLGLTVAAIGLYIALRGPRRTGVLLALGGVAACCLTVLVLIPHFNAYGQNTYLGQASGATGNPLVRFLMPVEKTETILMLLAPTAFLALRSPLLIIALPTIAWRFWATNPFYWGTGHHYSAVLMPVVFAAAAVSVPHVHTRVRAALPRCSRHFHRVIGAWCVVFVVLYSVNAPVGRLFQGATWRPVLSSAERGSLATIPDAATVAAENSLAPQLTTRTTVHIFPTYPNPQLRPNWVAVVDPPEPGIAPVEQQLAAIRQLPALGYELVDRREQVSIYRLTG
ncbi:DUF2079 domain-containing protein [Micromonospora polyrhachis]|uniref:Putative membrane protein n=1 Tax=Micromonospora polyrhachis TaxID=1282883 RepID=A0A7W7WPF1_9ACTN|nr:DUF2079 domain-containing protein [Micromonospora polyrhachis]MBB4958624.1 putative membrane protein [Micromonospora polyrhachis]